MNFVRKIFGWGLFFLGLALIFWSLYSSYHIFTAQAPVPEIFKIERIQQEITPPQEGIQAQIQKIIQERLERILPADFIPRFLNLIAWSIFACLLIFGGAQIASLGIKLLK